MYLPSSYKCPLTFTKAIKCKSTFSSKLGAYMDEQRKETVSVFHDFKYHVLEIYFLQYEVKLKKLH